MRHARRGARGFTLEKWYLDGVTPDGTASIAYWVRLTWRGMAFTWHGLATYAARHAPRDAWSLRNVSPPALEGNDVRWHAPDLDVRISHVAAAAPFTVALLDSDHGSVTWECLVPAANTKFSGGDGAALTGAGYAERLVMTLAPWELPIDELRWGRWISDDLASSLVWIDWGGAMPQRWVFRNGVLQDGAAVGDTQVTVRGGQLTFDTSRRLLDRSLGALVGDIPALAPLARRIPLTWHECKSCGRGMWTSESGDQASGWTIHEVVKLP